MAQNQALAKVGEFRSLPVVKSQVELSAALQELSKDYNVLIPPQMNFASSMHKIALEAVFIDNTVDEYFNGKDIYSVDQGKTFTFHGRALNRIAAAANLEWTGGGIKQRQVDDDGRVIFIEHEVKWRVKRVNGQPRSGTSMGSYKFEEDRKRFEKRPKQIEVRRGFAEQLAESNAKLRAVFEALEAVPRSMKREDFAKPFLVPCVIEDLMDMIRDDPAMKQMFIAAKTGIADQVYGPGAVRQSAPVVAHEDVSESPVSREVESEAVVVKTKREKWAAMDVNEQDEEMKRLLKEKGKAWEWKQLFGEMGDTKRLDALEYFDNLPAVVSEPAKEKMPWEKGVSK